MRNDITCRQVSAGHPDKLCDLLSDTIVTDCLRQDRNARVSIGCTGDGDTMAISGVISEGCRPNYEALIESVYGKAPRNLVLMVEQCPRDDGSRSAWAEPCGGAVYGYATNETPELLPAPFAIATRFLKDLADYKGTLSWAIGNDAEVQVTMDCWRNSVSLVQCRAEHSAEVSDDELAPVLDALMRRSASRYSAAMPSHITLLPSPAARRTVGFSGRCAPCDAYGGVCHMGGGRLSGCDPSWLGRSGSYMARKIARDIVLNGMADTCEVQLAYAAGRPDPVSVNVECFESERQPKIFLIEHIRSMYDLSPQGIIKTLGLLDMDFTYSGLYGHYGKGPSYPWEQ